MILLQEKAIFVNFKKIILRTSQNLIFTFNKKFFLNLHEASFLPRRIYDLHFVGTLCIVKCLLESQVCLLEYHTTPQSDFKAGESNFCRF